jgi:hypothetical protein
MAEDLDIVKYLLEEGADINAKSNDGKTMLHFAAANFSIDVVKLLVEEKEFGELTFRVTRRVGEKNRPKCSPNIFVKINGNP